MDGRKEGKREVDEAGDISSSHSPYYLYRSVCECGYKLVYTVLLLLKCVVFIKGEDY